MQEKVLMKGNEAIAEAAIRCGCRHYLGYPITSSRQEVPATAISTCSFWHPRPCRKWRI